MPAHAKLLEGRVALVTGATGGFGTAFCQVLAGAGATVVAVGRRAERLQELSDADASVIGMVCDIADPDAAARLVADVLDRFGGLDVLVNNAGITNVAPAVEETPEMLQRVLEVNLVSPYRLIHLFAPSMLAKGEGSIVNIASIVGLVGLGRMPQAAYAASKGGLVNLTRELSAQWARQGIRVNAIAPAFFPTEMTEGLFDNDGGRDWVARLTPMGRGGRLAELTGALLYFADPANSYTTGVILPVDGGWTAT